MSYLASCPHRTLNKVMLFAYQLTGGIAGTVASLVFSSIALSANQSILVISDAGSRIHAQVIQELKRDAVWDEESVRYAYTGDVTATLLQNYALAITLGHDAALITHQAKITTLNALLSSHGAADRRLCFSPSCPYWDRHYSIFLDQPIARQLNLLTTILPRAYRIGVLTGEFSANKLAQLQQEIEDRGLQLINRYIDSGKDLNHQFAELSRRSDVILALPDPLIHNRETVPYLLLTSYRYNIPFIGFSRAYVNAGAIAAVFSSPKQIARQIWELAERIIAVGNELKQKIYPPEYFTVYTNENVARSLEIRLPNREQIKLKLIQMEK